MSNKSSTKSQVRVGIAGLGRSGWNIHARTLRMLPEQFRIVAVADSSAQRRAEATQTFGATAYETFEKLVDDDSVELLIVATPSHFHVDHTIAALRAGHHVVCEKPLGLDAEEVGRSVEAARLSGRILTGFQNRRYEPHFLKVKSLIESGLLGRIVMIRMAWHLFGRRWDWQTLKRYGGGMLNNFGAHIIDQALLLIGDGEPGVYADLQQTLALGDTEDHSKIILKSDGAPTIDIELTSSCCYPQDRWLVMGTAGGIIGTMEHLEWKWVDWSTMPQRQVQTDTIAEGRAYQREELTWQSDSWDRPKDLPRENEYLAFYRDMFASIREGRPVAVTPESVWRQIAVIDACRQSAELGRVVRAGSPAMAP
jgi:predicted dehydrogenase